MALRTSVAEVIAASGTILDATLIAPFVSDANVYVNTRLVGKGIPESALTVIEKWIACYYAAGRDETLRIQREKTGEGEVELEERDRFLRRAMALDPTGTIGEDFDPDSEGFTPVLEVARTKRGSHFGVYE